METKANYVRVGLFTLIVLVLSFGFVYWAVFASSGDTRVPLILRIAGAVNGLQKGSQVQFNGLPVGSVQNLRLDPNNPGVVIVTTEVDAGLPIKEDTLANVGFAGLTGSAFIQLSGGTTDSPSVMQLAAEQGTVPVIRANPSDVTDILATARDIAERANNVIGQFETIVKAVGPSVETSASNITHITENVDTFTTSLANNSGQIDNFLASLSQLSQTANTVAEGLPDAIAQVRGILAAVDPEAISTVVQNVATLTDNLRKQSDNLGGVVDSVRTAANSVGQVGESISRNSAGIDQFLSNLGPISDTAAQVATKLDTTLASTNRVIAAVDPKQISSTLDGINSAATNISSLAETIGSRKDAINSAVDGAASAMRNIDRITATVAERSDDVNTLLANLAPISQNVKAASSQIGETITNANRVVAAVDPEKVSSTLDNVSQVSRDLSAVSQTIGEQREAISSVVSGASNAVQNVNRITTTIANRTAEIDNLLTGLGPITDNVRQATATLNQTATSANRLIASVDSATINQAIGDVHDITSAVGAKTQEIQSIIDGVDKTVRTFDTTLQGFSETRTQVDTLLASVDPAKVNRAVDNVSAATDNVAQAADSIRSVANAVGERRDDINAIITNTRRTTKNLDDASTKIQSVIDRVNSVLNGAGDGTGLGQDLASTLRSIRSTAQSLQAQIVPISANLQKFSGQGLRQVQDLISNVNRTVDNIDSAVTGFAKNPSQLIYGGGTNQVKQFDGRTRR